MRRFLIAAAILLHAALAVAESGSPYRFDGADRIVVFADVHGAYDPLIAILRETGVIDASLHWSAGRTRLVGLGDLVDRGPDSRKVLDLLMRLEGEAAAAGGAVHQILGNHEVMNIAGDLRYVSPPEFASYAGEEDAAAREATWRLILAKDPAASRAEFDTAFPPGYFGHQALFAPDGRYGRWLLGKPMLVVINDTAFVHAGLPPLVASLGLDATNVSLHAALDGYLEAWQSVTGALGLVRPIGFLERPETLAALPAPADADAIGKLQDGPLFTPDGPTWYRGQALCNVYAETANLDAALAKLGVGRVIEGHTVTPTGRVLRRFDGRVVLLDTGMLAPAYHGRASAMVFENGQWSVAYADSPGQRFQPETPPRAVGPRPRNLDDDALERWMAEAEVVSGEDQAAGMEPQPVTLRKDGVELKAVFDADSDLNDLAAYRLDRLLGLDMVPVTVERTVGKRRGVLQFQVDGSMSLRQMIEQKVAPSGWCPTNPQFNLMTVFDLLIHNTGRTQESALFTRDWMLVLTDHARAFGTDSEDPVLLYKNPVELPPALAKRLAALDRPALEAAVGRYLHKRQIDALLKRRDALLRRYGAGAAENQAAAR
jgi:hypothetical protein